MARNLSDDVPRGTKAVDADASARTHRRTVAKPRETQGSIADEPSTQERRRLDVAKALGKREAIARVGDGVFGVAPVQGVPGKLGVVAEVLAPFDAILATVTRPAEPRDANPIAERKRIDPGAQSNDRTHHFVSGNHRAHRIGKIAVQEVQIRSAHATRSHLDQHLSRAGRWDLDSLEGEAFSGGSPALSAHRLGHEPIWRAPRDGCKLRRCPIGSTTSDRLERIDVTGLKLLELRKRGRVGKVPALEIDGELVCDSTDIAYAIEAKHPSPPVLPDDPRERALCHVLEDWADESLYFMGLYERWSDREGRRAAGKAFRGPLAVVLPWFLASRAKRQIEGQGIGRKSPSHVAKDLARHVEHLHALLDGRPFLLGDQPMLCDFAVLGQLIYLARTPVGGRAVEGDELLTAYLDRMRKVRQRV